MGSFVLNSKTKIEYLDVSGVIKKAIERFYRDMDMTLADEAAGEGGTILLKHQQMEPESYVMDVRKDTITITAGDELGYIYALLTISEKYLGVQPFWFWNDQTFTKKQQVEIEEGTYGSAKYRVRYRGWFVNDEVLISHWDGGVSSEYPWEMVFEALLRLGGNMAIPGTDKNSKLYADLATEMGLWITHHHAEPLGAEMFARVYPKLTPSFKEHPDLFRGLWKEGIERQKGQKIVWNIGFRGQGDTPFWENDPAYDTPEKRGVLISSIMKEQYELIHSEIPDAVCCTNLYGEIMELYQQGLLEMPEDVIMIWADNGYGKMVSRRQGNHNPRIPALPEEKLADQKHGTYYHASFYDLQAANHITMLPNPMEFVEKELENAYSKGVREFWVINASNIKPHVYTLDFIANLWKEESMEAGKHREVYLQKYYPSVKQESAKNCLEEYFKCTLSFGEHEDERAGEQFYNYLTRYFIHGWMKNGGASPCEKLYWCTPHGGFCEQVIWYGDKCRNALKNFNQLLKACETIEDELWKDSVLLQVKLHTFCLEGAVSFTKAYEKYVEGKYMEAFYLLGESAQWYEQADMEMREREHDKWNGFYANDCLTDVKQTAHLLWTLMGYVRNLGDGPDFYEWQREVLYEEEDRRVVLITNMENHMTDQELYRLMKEKAFQSCNIS